MSQIKHDGILILGCPRSGTTLLRRILDAHPNIAAPGETYLFTACARFLKGETVVDGMDVGVLNGLGFAGFDSDQVLGRLREFAFTFRREHAAAEGKSRWVEKTAVDAFHVPEIERLCGDHAYFICVTRHGLDVACSMDDWCRKSLAYPSEIHPYIQRYKRPLEAFCHAWVDATTAIEAFASNHPDNAIVVRYEDLVTDPDAEMRRLVEFVGEDWDPETLSDALGQREAKGFSDWKTFAKSAVDKASIGRWRELPSATLNDLVGVVNPTLVQCEYEVVDAAPKMSAEEARRRYDLGLLFQGLKS